MHCKASLGLRSYAVCDAGNDYIRSTYHLDDSSWQFPHGFGMLYSVLITHEIRPDFVLQTEINPKFRLLVRVALLKKCSMFNLDTKVLLHLNEQIIDSL